MSLTEPQIRRYARHILLPEVGGRGQERLLAAKVQIRGDATLANLARSYLEAAGVTCEVHDGSGLTFDIAAAGQALGDVRITGSVGDPSCVSVHSSLGPAGPREDGPLPASPLETSMVAASLAASEVLRMVLGLGPASHEWQVRGHQLTSSLK